MNTQYHNLQKQIQRFVDYTQQAIQSLKSKQKKTDETILMGIADAIYQLEIESDQIMRTHDEDMRLEMQLLQNFIHNPVYFSKGKETKKLSIFHAAKTFHDLHDLSEMKAIVTSCAGNTEAFKTLISDLKMISNDVNEKLT